MGTIRNIQIVLNYPKDPFLNLATPKNTCQILITRKILELNFSLFFFGGGGGWGGRSFWSENGYTLCLSGMVFKGTTGVYERNYHFIIAVLI